MAEMVEQKRTSHLLNESLDSPCRNCCLEVSISGRMVLCVFISIIISNDPSVRSTDDFVVLIIRDCIVCKSTISIE